MLFSIANRVERRDFDEGHRAGSLQDLSAQTDPTGWLCTPAGAARQISTWAMKMERPPAS